MRLAPPLPFRERGGGGGGGGVARRRSALLSALLSCALRALPNVARRPPVRDLRPEPLRRALRHHRADVSPGEVEPVLVLRRDEVHELLRALPGDDVVVLERDG